MRRQRLEGPAIVALGLVCQEVGASLAVVVFPAAGPIGMVALRLCFSALVLWAVARPRLRGLTRASWAASAGYGIVLAAMNVSFYLALSRLPLGSAVTLEMLGPLTLSVLVGRRWTSVLWAAVALAGVVLLGGDPRSSPDPVGIAFALAAAALWAGYILLTKRTGEHLPGLGGVTLGMSVGALAVTPLTLATTPMHALLSPAILGVGLAVAILSSTIPYGLEMRALRLLAPGTFAILLALAPAIAALTGLIVLGQRLGTAGFLGIALVVAAGVGATRGTARAAGDARASGSG